MFTDASREKIALENYIQGFAILNGAHLFESVRLEYT